MGNGSSTEQAARAKERYEAVRGDDREITYSKLHEMVEIGGNPLLARLLPLFDKSGNGSLSLQEYQFALAQMAPSKPDTLRYKVAFKVMDNDKDLALSSEDLFWHLKGLLGHVLSEAQLQQMAQQALAAAGPEAQEAQQLTPQQLQELLPPEDLKSKLVLNL